MQYTYGPIPSRRLGQSLGVDPIPLKTCNWNCVYCQLGRTAPLINERRAWTPRADVVADVVAALAAHGALHAAAPGVVDYVSFVGSGEPTLHSELGWMIERVKALTPTPVAVITNGALLGDAAAGAAVRADLLAADVVMPTLCAADETLYRRIHRPHPALHLADMVEGLIALRRAYRGQLWVEVMLLRGVNDDEAALRALAALLAQITPDQVHLTLPERPPTEPWVAPPDADGLMRATAIFSAALGTRAHVVPPSGLNFDLSDHGDRAAALLAILVRHPMSTAQAEHALAQAGVADPQAVLATLLQRGRARTITRHGVEFWTAAAQQFNDITPD